MGREKRGKEIGKILKTLKVGGVMFMCSDCGTFYCMNCSNALSNLENMCWVCNTPIDPSKPVKPYKKEEEEVEIEGEVPTKEKDKGDMK